MILILAVFAALTLTAQTTLAPLQIGLPAAVAAPPTLVAMVNGKLTAIEIGPGIVFSTVSAGKYRLSVSIPPQITPVITFFQFRLVRLPSGNWPACAGMLFHNGLLMSAVDYTVAASGETVATWPAEDIVVCVTGGAPGAISLPVRP